MPTPREGYVLHSYGPGRYVKYVVALVHTLRRLGLTQPPRVQAGMIYAQDDARTREVDEAAAAFLERVGETHFRSRFDEGRSEETCEWSIALAMSKLDLHIFLWLQGRNSPQLDYVDSLVDHDLEFREVSYRLYTNDLVYRLLMPPCVRPFWVLLRAYRGRAST
jgi:hypothetical protein